MIIMKQRDEFIYKLKNQSCQVKEIKPALKIEEDDASCKEMRTSIKKTCIDYKTKQFNCMHFIP